VSVVFIVLPLALLIAAAAVVAFIWAVRGGQFDDLDTPGLRVLHDDEPDPVKPPATHPDDPA
jgi:cbb3-type cytochrome oxidase maturation protein